MLNRSTTKPRRRAGAAIGLLTAAALVLAGCSTSSNSASDADLPGITGDTVKLGYLIVDLGPITEALGFNQADYGGVEGQSAAIRAVVDHVNRNGGMGGRQAEVVIRSYNAVNDSPQNTEAMCKGLTQDDKVFAAVFDSAIQNNVYACYAGQRTLMIDETQIAHDQAQFDQYSPYLWSPTHPEYTAFMRTKLDHLRSEGWFEDTGGVLVVTVDAEVPRRITDQVVRPFLAEAGVHRSHVAYVDTSNAATLGASAGEAIAAGKAGRYGRVLVVGGARILPVSLTDQGASSFDALWSVSSFDRTAFLANNPDTIAYERLSGMIGLGYKVVDDLDADAPPPFPDPEIPAQGRCVDIISGAGATPPDNLRPNWKNALQFCDATMFLKAVLDQAPTGDAITGAEFKQAVGLIDATYDSSITWGSTWGPGVYAGTNVGKAFGYNDDCSCFEFSGGPIPLSATGPAAGSTAGTPTGAGAAAEEPAADAWPSQ